MQNDGGCADLASGPAALLPAAFANPFDGTIATATRGRIKSPTPNMGTGSSIPGMVAYADSSNLKYCIAGHGAERAAAAPPLLGQSASSLHHGEPRRPPGARREPFTCRRMLKCREGVESEPGRRLNQTSPRPSDAVMPHAASCPDAAETLMSAPAYRFPPPSRFFVPLPGPRRQTFGAPVAVASSALATMAALCAVTARLARADWPSSNLPIAAGAVTRARAVSISDGAGGEASSCSRRITAAASISTRSV